KPPGHREKIGEGVARRARARKWMMRTDLTLDDFILGIIFSKVTCWWFEGAPEGVTLISRDEFEALPKNQRGRVLSQYVTTVDPEGWSPENGKVTVEFVDGSRWPADPLPADFQFEHMSA